MLGLLKPVAPDGTFDLYEGETPDPSVSAARIAAAPREDMADAVDGVRPGLAMLEQRLRALPPATEVILLLPPVAAATLPLPQSHGERSLAACKAAVATLADRRPRTILLDWHTARPGTEITADFRDPSHYYDPLARAVEADIAEALQAVEAPARDRRP